MDTMTIHCRESASFIIVCDERCALVRRLGALVKLWDKQHVFTFVDRESTSAAAQSLINELDHCPWSLLLVDEFGDRWAGPEAIPIILKSLPFGKLAAVFYILPGTMWLTRQLYMFISRNRHRMVSSQKELQVVQR